MINRPLALKGNIIIRNNDNYIIGKIIKNQNIENDPSNYIQVLDNKNIENIMLNHISKHKEMLKKEKLEDKGE